jgi:uncharacterized protein YbjT (DUF2867 family)
MRVLVTGGTGVVGKSAVDALLEGGHTVRLFSRRADQDAAIWDGRVEAHSGSVAIPEDVRGAAEGCEVLLHIVGIVDETPNLTFEQVNVEGTRNMVREAERAEVQRFVFISSLGADTGASDYHRSKREAEAIVTAFSREWVILRPGNVYGPGDRVVSLLLKMVRTLPAVPVITGGDRPFQPIYTGDLAQAIARACVQDDVSGQTLEVAGDEQVCLDDLVATLQEVVGKDAPRLRVPDWLARIGAEAAETLGIRLPVNADQITMLQEGNTIDPPRKNALTETFHVEPIPLREGLKKLADTLPSQLPSQGWGALKRQRYWADIHGSRYSAQALFERFRTNFRDFLPEELLRVGAEPDTPDSLERGATLALAIPLRGNVQVRVAEVERGAVTCATVEGHALSGAIRFMVRDRKDFIRFEIRSYTRAASLVDMLGMATVGRQLQKATWIGVVEEVLRHSGGDAPDGVQVASAELSDSAAQRVERWSEELSVDLQKHQGKMQEE